MGTLGRWLCAPFVPCWRVVGLAEEAGSEVVAPGLRQGHQGQGAVLAPVGVQQGLVQASLAVASGDLQTLVALGIAPG